MHKCLIIVYIKFNKITFLDIAATLFTYKQYLKLLLFPLIKACIIATNRQKQKFDQVVFSLTEAV